MLSAALPFVGNILGGSSASDTAGQAAAIQAQTSQAAIDEQRRQFDALMKNLQPFITAGGQALTEQQKLLGLAGAPAQKAALTALESSPQMKALVAQGENAILQNAAATGGLRGGNVQGALAQFRPQVLSQLIESRYGNLGGLSQLGQSSAAGVGSAGMASAANIGNILGQMGTNQANAILGQGAIRQNTFSDLAGLAGKIFAPGGGGGGVLGGLGKIFGF